MTSSVYLTEEAHDDLRRLEDFLYEQALEHGDPGLPERAMQAIREQMRILLTNPYTCRAADNNPYERELIIPSGSTGYVALFEIVSDHEIFVAAIRHQREDDNH